MENSSRGLTCTESAPEPLNRFFLTFLQGNRTMRRSSSDSVAYGRDHSTALTPSSSGKGMMAKGSVISWMNEI
jgi:hypothetical protein